MHNNNNNAIADELDEIASVLSRIDVEDSIESVANASNEIAYLDTVAQKAEVPELRALSHWMMLNIELDSENQEQINTLFREGSYYNWMNILSSLLRQYDQSLLPQIYKALTDPNWLVKPSAPLLRNLAGWIESTKIIDDINPSSEISPEIDMDMEEVEPENLGKDHYGDSEIIDFSEDFDDIEINSPIATEKAENYYDDLDEITNYDIPLVSEIEEINTPDNNLLIDINEETTELENKETVEFIEAKEELHFDEMVLDNEQSDSSNNHLLADEQFITESSKPSSIPATTSVEIETNGFSDDADDIVMTLANITASAQNVFEDSDKHISELQRFDMLAEISGYPKLLPVSSWCQQNLKLFANNQSDDIRSFIESGECWTWIELTKHALAEPEDISHIAELSSELSRDEWLEPLAVDYLQDLLLFLRNPNDSDESDLKNKTEEAKTPVPIKVDSSGLSLSWDNDVHPELLEVYFEETSQNIEYLVVYLKGIGTNTNSKKEREDARRTAHTIKGGSAVVGISALSTFAHKFEMILDHAIDHTLSDDATKLLIDASSCLENIFKAILEKNSEPDDFSLMLSKMTNYAEALDEDDEPLELSAPVLPDFITQQNNSNNETSEYKEKASQEPNEAVIIDEIKATNDNATEKTLADADSVIRDDEKAEVAEITSIINNEVPLSTLSENEDLENFTAELDDIVMTLMTTEANTEKKPFELDAYIEELQRLDMLSEISGFAEVAKVSGWYQENLKLITKKSTKKLGEFISSGDSWAWIELISATLADPKESSHLVSLNNELTRSEWVKALDEADLQALLLVLKESNSNNHEEEPNTKPTQKETVSKTKRKAPASKAKKTVTKKTKTTAKKKTKAKAPSKTTSKKVNTKKSVSKKTKVAKKAVKKIVTKATKTPTKVAAKAKKTKVVKANIITWDKDVHPELLSVYLQETSEQVTLIAGLLHKISKGEADKTEQEHAARIAHTIKGASGVVGINEIVDFTHKLEDILDYAVNNKIPAKTADLLAESSDCLESLFEAVQEKGTAPEEYKPVLAKLTKYATSIENDDQASNQTLELDMPELPDFITHKYSNSNIEAANETPSTSLKADIDPATESHIRVPTTLINKLLNLAGELVTASSLVSDKVESTLETSVQIKDQDKRVHSMLDELSSTIIQQENNQLTMLSSMQNKDFDTLEMDTYNELHSVTSLLTESIYDSESIESTLKQQLNEIHDDLRILDNLNKELSDTILSSRMESLNTLVPRLERIIRQTCRKTGKKAELVVTGNDINIDTEILSGLVDPLLHLLRNAIDHGIESPKTRKSSKKDESGTISLDFSRQGNFIHMELKDNGAGINSEKIYQHAIEMGMITPDQEFSKNEILKLILQPGFSTQENVSDISGRGVGMDVVNKGIEALKGSLSINSELGEGTTFSIKIPLTLVTSSTLLVSTAGNQVAIPTDSIEQLFYLAPEDVLMRKKEHFIRHDGKELAIESLAAILGWNTEAVDFTNAQTLLLVKGEKELHAVYIDKIIHSREVVIKSLAHFIDSSNGVIGACHLTDGAVAPVLSLPQLLTQNEKSNHVIKKIENIDFDATNTSGTPQILVVDDSLSNRKALSLIIEKTEYDVITAVDGLDALNIMNEKTIDLVFTDLEMPRMTGLELTQAIRAWDEKKETPIVMVTSRSTNKHRELAKKAGVDDYLTKPVGTDTLLESIETWLKQTALA